MSKGNPLVHPMYDLRDEFDKGVVFGLSADLDNLVYGELSSRLRRLLWEQFNAASWQVWDQLTAQQ